MTKKFILNFVALNMIQFPYTNLLHFQRPFHSLEWTWHNFYKKFLQICFSQFKTSICLGFGNFSLGSEPARLLRLHWETDFLILSLNEFLIPTAHGWSSSGCARVSQIGVAWLAMAKQVRVRCERVFRNWALYIDKSNTRVMIWGWQCVTIWCMDSS